MLIPRRHPPDEWHVDGVGRLIAAGVAMAVTIAAALILATGSEAAPGGGHRPAAPRAGAHSACGDREFARAAAEAGPEQGLLVAGADHRFAVQFLDPQLRQHL